MAQSPEVEILIHITAPSRAVDDSRYRSLASAYLDFELEARLPIPSTSVVISSNTGSRHAPQTSQQQLSQGNDEHGSRPLGQAGPLASPTASFRSVLDNIGSPYLAGRNSTHAAQATPETRLSQVTHSTWQSPSGVIEDSVPRNNAMAPAFSSPTRVLEHYLQAFDGLSQPRVPSSGGSSEQIITGTPVQRQNNHGSGEEVDQQCPPTLIVPRTPLPETPFETGRYIEHQSIENKHGGSDQIIRDQQFRGPQTAEFVDEPTLTSSPEYPAVGRAATEPPPDGRPPGLAAGPSSRPLARTSSDAGPDTSRRGRRAAVSVDFLPSHGFTYGDLELRAPEPPASAARVEARDLVTPGLSRLARRLEAARRPFRPGAQARGLRPTERGYWLLDCSAWGAALRRDCWAFLANYVCTGAGGWGLRCSRDPGFLRLRAYCWGAAVPHVYRLLYLAAQREIKFTGASWVDGEGETVIVMGTRARR